MKVAVQVSILLWLAGGGGIRAATPVFSAILSGSGQDYATSVVSDAAGNTYVAGLTYSSDFRVAPGAAQTQFGGTCDAFVAKLGPDGTLIWSTYLGGILDDWATGIALDGAGNVLVTGNTRSANFPLVNAIQTIYNNGATDDFDAFVAKLSPDGSKLLYSTFLGGTRDDLAAGIASDAAGNAYVAVTTQSAAGFPGTRNAPDQFGIIVSKLNPQGGVVYSYFHPYGGAGAIALDAAGNVYVAGTTFGGNPATAATSFGPTGVSQAMAFKLSPDGTKTIFETALGGSVQANGAAIAVNGAGEVYVAGSTSSTDFPLMHPLQTSPGARPLWKSTDGGATWAPMDDLPFAQLQTLLADPSNSNTLYAGTRDLGIFKSLNGGATWTGANAGVGGTDVLALSMDPVHPQTLYAAVPTNSGQWSKVYKSVDGANSWTMIDTPLFVVAQIAVDAQNPNIVWEAGNNLRKTTDGGATWNSVTTPGNVAAFALDPRVSGQVFMGVPLFFCGGMCGNSQQPALYRSTDGGADWAQALTFYNPMPNLIVDGSTNPSTAYNSILSRSVDGGVTWTSSTALPGATPVATPDVTAFTVDPSGAVYAAAYNNGLFLSRDHEQSWTATGSPVSGLGPAIVGIVPAGSSGTLYAILNQVASSGFLTKLSADGSKIVYSTYLRGHASMAPITQYLAEPNAISTENWISAIALDAAGNATVAGGTRAVDFPVVMPAQSANAGNADAFVATVAPDGSQLTFSTYFGASADDGALAVGLNSQGNIIIAGQTWSNDFPVTGVRQAPFGIGDAFVVKLSTAPPVISAVLNGASFQPGIEAGSWVTIKGSNLAATNPGRTWRPSEIVGGNLPTALDGVSVTIDGKPAFVEYISPTQINVQAPSDSAVGAVNVVVTNNGAASAPAAVQLQSAAPAFFLNGGTNYAAASRVPDYAPVGDPSAIAGAVAAKPGDIVILWGTGFGATNPPVVPGTAVSGAPAVVTVPTVTVGGVATPLVSAVLSPGSAGLYQVAIQLPANVPSGPVAVQASVGGAHTQPGILLFVANP